MVKFVSNSIKVGKGVSFADLVKKIQGKNNPSSSDELVKIASAKDEDEKDEKKEKEDKKDEKDEKKDEKDEKKDCKSCEADAEVTTVKTAKEKEAPTSGQPQAEAKLVNVPDKGDNKKTNSKAKKECEEAPTSGQPQAEAKLVNNPKPYKDAGTNTGWVKIAKLDGKSKNFFKKYWTQLFGPDYAEAMLVD